MFYTELAQPREFLMPDITPPLMYDTFVTDNFAG